MSNANQFCKDYTAIGSLPAGTQLCLRHTVLNLRSSAKKCPICELFLTDLSIHGSQETAIKIWDSELMFSAPMRWLNTDLRGVRLKLKIPATHVIVGVADLHLWRPGISSISSTIILLIREKAIGTGDVLQQAPGFTDCARSWERAKHWLQTCIASHPACRHKIEPGNLPTRLVYVGRNLYNLRLHLSKDLPPTRLVKNTRYRVLIRYCYLYYKVLYRSENY